MAKRTLRLEQPPVEVPLAELLPYVERVRSAYWGMRQRCRTVYPIPDPMESRGWAVTELGETLDALFRNDDYWLRTHERPKNVEDELADTFCMVLCALGPDVRLDAYGLAQELASEYPRGGPVLTRRGMLYLLLKTASYISDGSSTMLTCALIALDRLLDEPEPRLLASITDRERKVLARAAGAEMP